MPANTTFDESLPMAYYNHRPFPRTCLEIYLLDQARHRSSRREFDLLNRLAYIFDWRLHRDYETPLRNGSTLVVTDTEGVIIWASSRFLTMTGYTPAEALGQTPAFLQGPDTDTATVRRLSDRLVRASLTGRIRPIRERILNYRKGGEKYWCELEIDPLWTTGGELTHFLAIEKEID